MANSDPCSVNRMNWRQHVVRASLHCPPSDIGLDPESHREHVEPWLSALFRAKHLNVLIGSGLTTPSPVPPTLRLLTWAQWRFNAAGLRLRLRRYLSRFRTSRRNFARILSRSSLLGRLDRRTVAPHRLGKYRANLARL